MRSEQRLRARIQFIHLLHIKMKTRICSSFAAFGAPLKAILVAACFLCAIHADVDAQSANKPVNTYTISYQGSVGTPTGIAVSGTHRIGATLYSSPMGSTPVWHGEYTADVTDGIFSITL